MFQRFKELLARVARAFVDAISAARIAIVAFALFLAVGYALYKHPPIKTVARGEVGVRINRLTGEVSEWRDGSVLRSPGCTTCASSRCATRPIGPTQIAQRRRPGAAAVGRGAVARRRPYRCATRSMPRGCARSSRTPARRHRRRDRRAGGAGRDLQGVRALHGARNLLDQARRDPAGDRDRARAASSPPTASCCAAC